MISPLKAYSDLLYTQKEFSFPKSVRFPRIPGLTPTEYSCNVRPVDRSRSPSFGVGDRFKPAVCSKQI